MRIIASVALTIIIIVIVMGIAQFILWDFHTAGVRIPYTCLIPMVIIGFICLCILPFLWAIDLGVNIYNYIIERFK